MPVALGDASTCSGHKAVQDQMSDVMEFAVLVCTWLVYQACVA